MRLPLANNGFGEFLELPPIDECFENVLLRVVVVVDNRRGFPSQLGQIFDILVHAVVVDVIGGRLCAQQPVVPYILL